ncbi:hypothetical protein QQ045_029221 [Rhodiola kirilowii]
MQEWRQLNSLLHPFRQGAFLRLIGLRASPTNIASCEQLRRGGLSQKFFRGLSVKAATVVLWHLRILLSSSNALVPDFTSLIFLVLKYTTLKPLGDRVLVKIDTAEEKTTGGILLPTTAQTKPQGGEVVAVGEGRTIGNNKIGISVENGPKVVYSKYAGTEVEFNGTNHLILKEDDIVGILETDDVKDLKPLNDRVLIKVAEAEEKTAGGLLLTASSKEKPSIGTVIAVGPGPLDEEGNRKPLSITPGNTVLYSKYAGNDHFKGVDADVDCSNKPCRIHTK